MNDVIVLMYHHVSPLADIHSVTVRNFESQLVQLKSAGYRFLSGTEFQAWREGRLGLDKDSVLLTFDDGWLDNWLYALPLLMQFHIPAVFFVVTDWPGNGPPRLLGREKGLVCRSHTEATKRTTEIEARDGVVMRWSELLAARESGLVSLHSHSNSHGDWWRGDLEWADRMLLMEKDLLKSREVLMDRVGQWSEQLCWPKGLFTLDMVQRAKNLGFEHQFSTLRGPNAPLISRLVRRMNVEDQTGERLVRRVSVSSHPLVSAAFGMAHQAVYQWRMLKAWGGKVPRRELSLPCLQLV